MNRGPITVRYARGLFELGRDKNILDQLYDNSRLLLHHCLEVEDFCVFLKNPVIKASDKKRVLQKVLGNEQNPMMLRFINLVVEKNRESLLRDMILYFDELYRKEKGIKSVKIITAVSLDKEYLGEVKIFLERELAAPVDFHFQVKPEIIGGLIIIVDGRILDSSVSHQMKLIRKKLLS